MTTKIYLSTLQKKYKISYVHNPKHFFLNTLYIENLPNGKKLLCAHPRPHSKQFHRLAILTPIVKTEVLTLIKTERKNKPFNGIFQD